jgi:hypothetical protein
MRIHPRHWPADPFRDSPRFVVVFSFLATAFVLFRYARYEQHETVGTSAFRAVLMGVLAALIGLGLQRLLRDGGWSGLAKRVFRRG